MNCYFYLAYSNPNSIPFYTCCNQFNILNKGDKVIISYVIYEVVDIMYDYDKLSDNALPSVDIIVKPNTQILY